jgi:O-antigen ligase
MRRLAYQLCLLLVFTIPWESVVTIVPGVSVLTILLGLAVSGVWGLSVLHEGRMRRPTAFHGAALAFVLWAAASILWSADAAITAERAGSYLQLLFLTLLLWDLIDTPERLRAVLQAYVLGCYVCFGQLAINRLTLPPEEDRITAGAFGENTVAFILSLGLPLAWHLGSRGWREGQRWLRALDYAFVPLGALGILWTGSRSGVLAVGVTALYILVSGGVARIGRRLVVTGVAVGLVAGAAFVKPELLPEAVVERITSTGDEVSRGDWNGRLEIWQEALARYAENPVLGVGSGAFKATAVESGKTPHNFVLSLLSELGLVGLVLFLAVIAVAGIQGLAQPRAFSTLWMAVLLSWGLNALLHNYESKKPTWLFFTLTVVSAALYGSAREGSEVAGRRPAGAAAQPGMAS